MFKKISAGVGMSFLLPVLALAQVAASGSSIFTVVSQLISSIIPILIAIAVLYFLWNVVVFVINSGDSAKRKDAGVGIAYGILAIFIMVSVWGLVNLLGNSITFDSSIPDLPKAPNAIN